MGDEGKGRPIGPFRPEYAKIWIVIAIAAVSTAAILIKLSSSHPLTISFWRVLIAWLILLPFGLYRMRKPEERPGLYLIFSMIFVGLALALHFGMWIWSFQYTKVSSSVLLVTTHPIFVAGISYWLFKERLGRWAVVGIVLALLGSAIIVGGDFSLEPSALTGDLLSLGGSLMAGVYILSGSRFRKEVSLPVYAVFVYGSAAVFLLAAGIAIGVKLVVADHVEYIIFGGLAVGPMLAGHTIYNWALKYVSPTVVSVTLLGEPIGSTILALILLAEAPYPGFYLGAPVVMAGIFMVARFSGRNRSGS
ncbi:MAG: DMT family transporter [Thermoplasmatota archaeon]